MDKLRQLIKDKLQLLLPTDTDSGSQSLSEDRGLRRLAIISQELTFDLLQLQSKTQEELSHIHSHLCQIDTRRQQLNSELKEVHQKKTASEQSTERHSLAELCAHRGFESSISDCLRHLERLLFQRDALNTLHDLLTQDLQRYKHETQQLRTFTEKILRSKEAFNKGVSEQNMQVKTEGEHKNMQNSESVPLSSSSKGKEDQTYRANYRQPELGRSTRLQRSSSIKDLISKFSTKTSLSKSSSSVPLDSPLPGIMITPPLGPANIKTEQNSSQSKSQISARIDCPQKGSTNPVKTPTNKSLNDSGRDSGVGSESEFEASRQLDSPEDEPVTPRPISSSQNPKYQLYLNNDLKPNGISSKDQNLSGGTAGGENGSRPRWESTRLGLNSYRGSLESLTSRDWDTMSDRVGVVDSPPRVFNSPYSTTTSMDYNPMYRMSEYKTQGGLSPATSELNLYSYNGRSTSPVPSVTLGTGRTRFSTFETLRRRPEISTTVVPSTHYSVRSATLGNPNKKDYIEELTKQLDACQKRNQFLEAESVEMEKERNQIRFEMRGLLVNNEDLLRTNTQLTNELKKMREQMIEIDRESQTVAERCREMEIEVKQAREIMVEANNQEYAFNFLQQSLKNQIQDTEENLEKQTQHAQTLAEKLWRTERQLEEFELDKDSKDKKTLELNNTVLRLEAELVDALQVVSQANAERNLQVKLREDTQLRVDELEESLLEKEQEINKLQALVARLQGEVSGKLVDKERSLEEEIQLRERLQLQCKQAERSLEDLRMELYTSNQSRDELSKQLKVAQEKMIDLETDLEELHDSEQRWAAKHKRAIEQMEQLQLKVIQQKDLNEQLEMDKDIMERQLRELRLEVEELQSSRVQEDVISKTESRLKELENSLRAEERNKAVLNNTISKLERKINELTDQLEEEHRISNEQKELMTQRMRSLKRQLNEVEEEASRKEAQCRFAQRELAEERETRERLQRQRLDEHLQTKRKEALTMRQTLDSLRLDLSIDDEEEEQPQQETVTKV